MVGPHSLIIMKQQTVVLPDTIKKRMFYLVQFKNIGLLNMPRGYFATLKEIDDQLKKTSKNNGDTII